LRIKAQPDAAPTPLREDANSSSSEEVEGESSLTATSNSNYDQLPVYMKSCLDYIWCLTMKYYMKIDKVIRLLVADG
ncbi:hypothetical protein K8353_50965, partial [Burkholderia contaminans]|nr:hypothetical protein [Burkholderia contaminans]